MNETLLDFQKVHEDMHVFVRRFGRPANVIIVPVLTAIMEDDRRRLEHCGLTVIFACIKESTLGLC